MRIRRRGRIILRSILRNFHRDDATEQFEASPRALKEAAVTVGLEEGALTPVARGAKELCDRAPRHTPAVASSRSSWRVVGAHLVCLMPLPVLVLPRYRRVRLVASLRVPSHVHPMSEVVELLRVAEQEQDKLDGIGPDAVLTGQKLVGVSA